MLILNWIGNFFYFNKLEDPIVHPDMLSALAGLAFLAGLAGMIGLAGYIGLASHAGWAGKAGLACL